MRYLCLLLLVTACTMTPAPKHALEIDEPEWRAKKALDDLYADPTLPASTRRERLIEIRDEIEMKLETMPK